MTVGRFRHRSDLAAPPLVPEIPRLWGRWQKRPPGSLGCRQRPDGARWTAESLYLHDACAIGGYMFLRRQTATFKCQFEYGLKAKYIKTNEIWIGQLYIIVPEKCCTKSTNCKNSWLPPPRSSCWFRTLQPAQTANPSRPGSRAACISCGATLGRPLLA